MQTQQINKITDTMKILADPTRLQILYLLFRVKKELCVGEIADAVSASHSAVSHQLDKLEARGIVSCTRKGQMMCYEIVSSLLTKKLQNAIDVFQ